MSHDSGREQMRRRGRLADMTDQEKPLEEALDAMTDHADGDRTTLGQVMDGLQRRGFGPFIAILATVICTPLGAIPGAPLVIGVALILFAGQILIGRQKPWFPERLRQIEVSSGKIKKGVDYARPAAQFIGRFLHPRFEWLASGPVPTWIVAAVTVLCAVIMIPVGFIPLMPFVFGLPIVFFGLGLMARDGLVTGLGYLVFLGGLAILATQLG